MHIFASTRNEIRHGHREQPLSHFKTAEWSPDGTCVIANGADSHIRTYIIPADLLDQTTDTHGLEPYTTIPSANTVDAVQAYPGFDLQDPSTTLLLSAVNEAPIRLTSAVTGKTVASYPYINQTTEAYIKPHALTFSPNSAHFVAGSDSLITCFDTFRPGQEPVVSYRTGPKNNKSGWHNPAVSMRGIVSALNVDPNYNILVAGTLTRQIGLYDGGGRAECVGVFSVQGTEADEAIGGSGITQVEWSPCGRYLYIAERKSTGIMVYDIRKTGQLLSWVVGRAANTNQRMFFDLATFADPDGNYEGHNVWAGGVDGYVRGWKSPHYAEGSVAAAFSRQIHRDSVNCVSIHRTANIVLSACGQRHFVGTDEDETTTDAIARECSIRIWSMSEVESRA